MAKSVTIQADASQTGLGAALMQDGQPISYASRAMTDTEQNYAQIEKELLAIVFACERFNDYIYGRNVVHVETDHKRLESIFKKEIHMAPKRDSSDNCQRQWITVCVTGIFKVCS